MQFSRPLVFSCLFFLGCDDGASDNELSSTNIEPATQRVKTLLPLILAPTPIIDAEYVLFNANGFGNKRDLFPAPPAPSYWSYDFVVKVTPDDVEAWTDGFIALDSMGNQAQFDIIPTERAANWTTSTLPSFYARKAQGVVMVVFPQDGIIYKRVIQQ